MYISTGIDVIEIDRIALAIERWGDRFLERLYTEGERAHCRAARTSLPGGSARCNSCAATLP